MDSKVLRLRIERADETVRRAVTALMRIRSLTQATVADDVGIPLATLERRLTSSGSSYAFTAGEVQALTEYFGIEGDTLFHYMDQQYRPPREWTPTRQPSAPADAAQHAAQQRSSVADTQVRLEAGIAIGRAQGMLMELHQSTEAEALAVMSTQARRQGVSMVAVALAVLDTGALPETAAPS